MPILQRRPIAQQLIIATIAALIIVFSVLTLIVQDKANSSALAVTENNLENEAKLMSGALDALYDAVKVRGDAESQFFLKYAGGSRRQVSGSSRRAMSSCRRSGSVTRCLTAMIAYSRLFAI